MSENFFKGGRVATQYDTFDRAYYPGRNISNNSRRKKRVKPTKCKKKGKELKTCPICQDTRYNLSQHMALIHPDMVFECQVCGQVYARPSTNHLKKKHKLEKVAELNLSTYYIQKKRSQVSPAQLAAFDARVTEMSRTNVHRSLLRKDRKKSRKEAANLSILPTLTFNCHDCLASFHSMNDLFTHCKTRHRTAKNGKQYPYLVPVDITKFKKLL